jgi:thioredoxin:protein disulfide reductase
MPESLSLTAAQISASGWGVAAGIAYIGGLLTAFTPCVYPMIPVTLGIMGARKTSSHLHALALSLFFVMGLALVYSSLGFAAAATGQLLGSITQSSYLVTAIALLFLALGLSLLGLYDIQIPPAFASRVSRFGHAGYLGSFALGAVSGILAAPCSGPSLVGILAFVAQKNNPTVGFLLLFLFSIGLGTPFVVLGTFSSTLQRIPKSGIWTEWIKHICGLALVAVAYYYAKPLVPPMVFTILLALGFLAIAIWFEKIFVLETKNHAFSWSGRAAVLMIIPFLWFGSPKITDTTPEWLTFEQGMAKAKAANKLLVVDFWATWCEACHELDDQTYSDASVQKILSESFVIAKVDATDPTGDEKVAALIKKYEVTGLPTVLFIKPDGKALTDLTLTGFLPAQDFKELLNTALTR